MSPSTAPVPKRTFWLILLLVLAWPWRASSSTGANGASAHPEPELTLFHPRANPETLLFYVEQRARALRKRLDTLEKEPKPGAEAAARNLTAARDELKTLEALSRQAAGSSDFEDRIRTYREALVHVHRIQVLLDRASRPDASASVPILEELFLREIKPRLVAQTGHVAPIRTFTFSTDGERLATTDEDEQVVLWDTATGLELSRHPASEKGRLLHPDGTSVLIMPRLREAVRTELNPMAVLQDGTVRLLRAGSGSGVYTLPGRQKPEGVTISPSGQYLATYGSGGLQLWRVSSEARTLQEERFGSPELESVAVRQAAFAPAGDRTWLAVLRKDGVLHLLELESHRVLLTVRPLDLAPRELSLAPDGRYLSVTLADGKKLWWNLREGSVDDTPPENPHEERESPLGPIGTFRWEPAPSPVENRVAAVLRNGHGVAMGYGQLDARQEPPTGIVLSPMLDRAAVLHDKGQLSILVLRPSAEGLFLKADESTRLPLTIPDVRTAVFNPAGRHLYVGRTDGLIQLWDLSTQTLVAQFIAWPDGRWVVADSEGRFDSSNGGDGDGLHWVHGFEPIALSRMKSRYYEPFLLAKVAGFQDERPREVRSFTAPKRHPHVRVQVQEDGAQGPRLQLTLVAREGGIGRALVSLNGKELLQLLPPSGTGTSALPARLQSILQEGTQPVSCTWRQHRAVCDISLAPFARFFQRHALRYSSGQPESSPINLLSIQAYNSEENLLSEPETLAYTPPGVPSSRGAVIPRLWAVVAGVSDYEGGSIDLRFAAKDADDFARALELTARRLLCAREDGSLDEHCDRVHIRRLSTSPGLQQQCLEAKSAARPFSEPGSAGPSCTLAASKDPCRPDKSNLLNALEELKQAAPEDIVVVYLAGHGATFNGGDSDAYHYLTADAWSLDVADSELRCRGTLSSTTLSEALRRIPARKQALILDTCNSCTMKLKPSRARNMSSSQMRALEQLQDQTGLYLLAGTPIDTMSYESPELEQGLLTYSLLEELAGQQSLARDARVDVGRLFESTSAKVGQVNKGMERLQCPMMAIPRSEGSLFIGQMTEKEQQAIQSHLRLEPLPIFVNSWFINNATSGLEASLRDAVSSELKERGERGNAELVFFNVVNLPGTYKLAVSLDKGTGAGAAYQVTGRLFSPKGAQAGCGFQIPLPPGTPKNARGTATAPPDLPDEAIRSLAVALVDGALKELERAKSPTPSGCLP